MTFVRIPAVKVDNWFHCFVHSLLLNASNAFSMSDAPLDRNYDLGEGCV